MYEGPRAQTIFVRHHATDGNDRVTPRSSHGVRRRGSHSSRRRVPTGRCNLYCPTTEPPVGSPLLDKAINECGSRSVGRRVCRCVGVAPTAECVWRSSPQAIRALGQTRAGAAVWRLALSSVILRCRDTFVDGATTTRRGLDVQPPCRRTWRCYSISSQRHRQCSTNSPAALRALRCRFGAAAAAAAAAADSPIVCVRSARRQRRASRRLARMAETWRTLSQAMSRTQLRRTGLRQYRRLTDADRLQAGVRRQAGRGVRAGRGTAVASSMAPFPLPKQTAPPGDLFTQAAACCRADRRTDRRSARVYERVCAAACSLSQWMTPSGVAALKRLDDS